MSADVLREAAALMRKRAAAATPGPWEALTYDSGLSYRALNALVITAAMGDSVCNADYDGDAEGPHGDEGTDADHIASWHPGVALAVANWLEATARELDALNDPDITRHPHDGRRTSAMAVARAYLGRDA